MIRSTISVLAATVLAAASLLLPDSTAHSAAPMTAKQARLKGLTASPQARPEQKIGRMIVKLRGDALGASAQGNRATRVKELEATAGAEMEHVRDLAGGAALMALKSPVALSEARVVAARLMHDAAVEYAEPDIMMKRTATPNEPRFLQWQWNLFAPTAMYTGTSSTGNKTSTAVGGTNMELAWNLSTGSSDVIVAVIDTGIVNHTDLNGAANADTYTPAGRFLAGYDFIAGDAGAPTLPANFVANDGNGRDADASDPGDWVTAQQRVDYPALCDDGITPAGQDITSSWHGSHMAGVLAATTNNSTSPTTGGIAGVAWNVSVLPVRALGRCGGMLSDISDAIQWAAGVAVPGVPNNTTPAQVVSLSLGGDPPCSGTMQSAVNAAIANGAVVVAATGNAGLIDSTISPAVCSGVIGVTAHTINGENADYANIGAGTDISAPGGGTPTLLGAGGLTDDSSWQGYFIWSTLLFGNTTPTSSDNSNPPRSGPAYGGFTGTSPATPHVAGVAALVKSFVPAATPAYISQLITSPTNVRAYPTGSACATGGAFEDMCGAGLLDANLVMTAATVEAPPLVNAGVDQVVAPGAVVTLSGSATAYGSKTISPSSYQWSQTGGTPTVTLATPNSASTTFTAPATGNLTFRLTATDSNAKVGQDTVVVRINSAPVLGAVADQSATSGQVLSFTVTATDADNDTLTFVATAASSVPLNALGPTGQFTWNTTGVPAGNYQLVYFATDGIAQTATRTVAITIAAAPAGAPAPTGGGGNGALPLPQLLLLAALLLAARIKRREDQAE